MNGVELKKRIKLELGLSASQVAVEMGVTAQAMSAYFSSKDVRQETLDKIDKAIRKITENKYGLYYSVGEDVEKEVFVNGRRKDISVVPLYDVDVSAGLHKLFASGGSLLGNISIPNMPSADGAVHVTGDSMYPLIKAGDIIAYRVLNDLSSITYGEIYILQLEHDGDMQVVVKYVKKSEEPDSVLLVSYNKEHDPMDVPLQWITAIARVTFSIRKYSLF